MTPAATRSRCAATPACRNPMDEDFGALAWYTKGYVRVGDPVTGNIGEHGAEADVFASLLRAGRTYLIEAKGSETSHGTMEDPSIVSLQLGQAGIVGGRIC